MLIVVGSNNIKKNVCTSFYQHEICIIHKLEADKRRLVEAVLGHMETKLNSLGRTPLTAFPIACLFWWPLSVSDRWPRECNVQPSK